MKPKYFKDFKAVLAHLRHKDQEYVPVKAEKKSATKKSTKKKSTKKKEK